MGFTNIPNTKIDLSMSKILGKASSAAQESIQKAVGKAKEILYEQFSKALQAGTAEARKSAASAISSLSGPISTAKKASDSVGTTIDAAKAAASAVLVPVKSLEATVKVIKALPMLQTFLPVNFTTVYSDTLVTCMESIKQAKETAESILATVEVIHDKIESALSQVPYIEGQIAAQLTALSMFDAGEELTEMMNSQGISTDLVSDLNLMSLSLGSGGKTGVVSVGGAGSSVAPGSNDSGINSVVYENVAVGQGPLSVRTGEEIPVGSSTLSIVKALNTVEPGEELQLESRSGGDWIQTVYSTHKDAPVTPVSREAVPEGWSTVITSIPEGYKVYSTSALISSETGKAGIWSNVEELEDALGILNSKGYLGVKNYSPGTEVFKVKVLKGYEDLRRGETGILVLKTEQEVQDLIRDIYKALSELPFKDEIRRLMSKVVLPDNNSRGENITGLGLGTGTYISARTGIKYSLRVSIDPYSSEIAPRRFVQVLDPSGVIVLEGTKTYSTDDKVLIEEMKIRMKYLVG